MTKLHNSDLVYSLGKIRLFKYPVSRSITHFLIQQTRFGIPGRVFKCEGFVGIIRLTIWGFVERSVRRAAALSSAYLYSGGVVCRGFVGVCLSGISFCESSRHGCGGKAICLRGCGSACRLWHRVFIVYPFQKSSCDEDISFWHHHKGRKKRNTNRVKGCALYCF